MNQINRNTDINISFEILGYISAIERFTGQWMCFEKSAGQSTLKQLSSDAINDSVLAALALEERHITSEELQALVFNLDAKAALQEPNRQLALGYYEVLENIKTSYHDIEISEQSIKHLHSQLFKYTQNAPQQKGKYKLARNTYELTGLRDEPASYDTTPAPGIETEYAMRALLEHYQNNLTTHPLIKSAIFIQDFLRIHPFQTGNVYMSNLLGTLLLLKSGYSWMLYESFEQVLVNQNTEYLHALGGCQKTNSGPTADAWLQFYFNCLKELQLGLSKKLEQHSAENQLAPRDKKIYTFIERHPGCKSGQMATKLGIPLPTIKKLLADMSAAGLITKLGVGAGTNYTAQKLRSIKTDIALQLNEKIFLKTFILEDKYSFVSIKKIILSPRFEWQRPEEWQRVLVQQNLELKVKCITGKGKVRKQSYRLASFLTDYHFQPVFTLKHPIQLPQSLWEQAPYDNEFRIKASIELSAQEETLKFDVTVVYDAGLVQGLQLNI